MKYQLAAYHTRPRKDRASTDDLKRMTVELSLQKPQNYGLLPAYMSPFAQPSENPQERQDQIGSFRGGSDEEQATKPRESIKSVSIQDLLHEDLGTMPRDLEEQPS